MKSKKKLLLMGVGVMGALAMGVGATSTFAWYTAAAKVKINASGSPFGLTATQSTADITTLSVTFTFSQVGANVELSHYDNTDITYGAVPAGVDAETQTHNWDGDQSKQRIVGEYKVTATATPTSAQKDFLKGKSFDVAIESLSNIVILGGAAGAYTDAATYLAGAKTTASSPKITVSFDGDTGEIVTECVESNPYFRIEPNNLAGRDYFAATNALGQVATGYSSSATYAVGAFVSQGGKVYKCKTAVTSAEEFDSEKWVLVDHSEDKIQIVAGQTAVGANGISY